MGRSVGLSLNQREAAGLWIRAGLGPRTLASSSGSAPACLSPWTASLFIEWGSFEPWLLGILFGLWGTLGPKRKTSLSFLPFTGSVRPSISLQVGGRQESTGRRGPAGGSSCLSGSRTRLGPGVSKVRFPGREGKSPMPRGMQAQTAKRVLPSLGRTGLCGLGVSGPGSPTVGRGAGREGVCHSHPGGPGLDHFTVGVTPHKVWTKLHTHPDTPRVSLTYTHS